MTHLKMKLTDIQIIVLFWIEHHYRLIAQRIAGWLSSALMRAIRRHAQLRANADPNSRMADEIIGILGIMGFAVVALIVAVEAADQLEFHYMQLAWSKQ